MFDRPKVGKKVRVVTDWSDYVETSQFHVQAVYGKGINKGTVVENNPWDDPASFNITTGNPTFPVANIPLDRVEKFEYLDGSEAKVINNVNNDSEVWTVEGSNGSQYVVTRKGQTWSCECKGFQFRAQCKHVNEKKEEVLESLTKG